MTRPCVHEDAVLAMALGASDVPPPESVLAHLAGCENCRRLHALTASLRDQRALAMAAARLPSAGQVWWRAELRARQEAVAVAARPITVVAGVAMAALVGLCASLLGAVGWWARSWTATTLASIANLPAVSAWSLPTVPWLAVYVTIGAMVMVTPLVLYLATRDE